MPPRLEAGEETERLQVAAPIALVRRLDEWRRQQERIPTRSAAIRMLMEIGLDVLAKKGGKGR